MATARAWLITAALLAGCREKEAPPASADAGGVSFSPLARSSPAGSPLSQAELPTTDGAIAVGNLNGQINSVERAIAERDARKEPAGEFVAKAVALLSMRGQFLGRLADYDRADALADRQVREAPKDARAYLLRAGIRSTLHRFADAEADLRTAEKLGLPAAALAAQRATIAQATGRLDEALALRKQIVAAQADIQTMGAEAALLGEVGDLDGAEKLFIEAQHHFSDVAAFPVAWLYLQEGLMWQRAGRLPRARELLEAAVARLPAYAPAASHLAGVLDATGERARAVALLRPIADASDDPEYAGQLADLLRSDGKTAEASALRARAAARYDELLARHPEAFADHAARFFLAGGDAKRALALAEKNLAARKSPDAFSLAIEAALAAADPARACSAADGALAARAFRTSHLHVVAWKAYSACGRKDKADAELAASQALARADGGT